MFSWKLNVRWDSAEHNHKINVHQENNLEWQKLQGQ
jgi:hypothetical protein